MGKVFEIDQNKSGDSKKSKRTKKSTETLVQFILDETGSMDWVRDSTIDGFNEYVNGLRNDKKNKYRLALTKFDSNGIIDVFNGFIPIKEFPVLTREMYKPNAMTNLNDAIGVTITNMEKKYGGKKNINYLVVIMTDGQENASREWTADTCRKLIKKQEKKGWTITFLGANMDAQKVASTYSIRAGNAKTYSTANMAATMRGLSNSTQVYASNALVGSASTDFFAGTDDWTEGEETTKQKSTLHENISISSVDNHNLWFGDNAATSVSDILSRMKKNGGKDNG